MAGALKPNEYFLGNEASYTHLGGSGVYTAAGAGLFTGVIGAWNSADVCYWNSGGGYVDVEILSDKVNIWRINAEYGDYTGKLQILRFDGADYTEDVTAKHTMEIYPVTNQWSIFVRSLPAGKYRFIKSGLSGASNASTSRLDGEWFIEDCASSKIKDSLLDVATIGDVIMGDYLDRVENTLHNDYQYGQFTIKNLGKPSGALQSPTLINNNGNQYGFNNCAFFIYAANDFLGRKVLIADRLLNKEMWQRHFMDQGVVHGIETKDPIRKYLVPIYEDKDMHPSITLTSSGNWSGYEPRDMFNAELGNGTGAIWISASGQSGGTTPWFKIDFGTNDKRKATGCFYQRGSGENTTRWTQFKVEGSNDDTNWDLLLTTDVFGQDGERPSERWDFDFDDQTRTEYRYFKVTCLDNNGGSYAHVGNFNLYDQDPDLLECNVEQKMMSGGAKEVWASYSEWNNWIINNTLGGLITAGDEDVWHGNSISNVGTQCRDTQNPNRDYYRITRGYSSLTHWTYNRCDSELSQCGFRPMLLVTVPAQVFYLLKDGTTKYTIENGSLVNIGSGSFVESDFKNNGFQLDVLTDTLVRSLSNPELHGWDKKNTVEGEIAFQAVPAGKLLLQTKDLSLSQLSNVDFMNVNATVDNNSIVKVILSTDEGSTWKTYDGADWQTINPTENDVKTDGMEISTLNAISSAKWNELIGEQSTIRFGYYIEQDVITDTISIERTTVQVDMQGIWKPADVSDANYGLADNTIKIMLYSDGNYKVNY